MELKQSFFCRRRMHSIFVGIGLLVPSLLMGDSLPFTSLSLDDMKSFRTASKNWDVTGMVRTDCSMEKPIFTKPGKGVLVSTSTQGKTSNIFTTWEHGDLELEIEFLMAKGSDSGIYLQGRYELQLSDSWGIKNTKFSDTGGIYRGSPTNGDGGGWIGRPPRVNVSRAPGLWQHLKIIFQAPRFDAKGQKIANAKFSGVVHNGVLIHENVEVPGPTFQAAFQDEKPLGPLVLQGGRGPVAFRNIRYKMYGAERVQLKNIRYSYFEGKFEKVEDFGQLAPVKRGDAQTVAATVAESPHFALDFVGSLNVPKTGNYLFELYLGWISSEPDYIWRHTGGGKLWIDNKPAIDHRGRQGNKVASGQIYLQEGIHAFRLSYFKNYGGQNAAMSLYCEGPGIPRDELVPANLLPPEQQLDEIKVIPTQAPIILRSFLHYKGSKRTHCVSVGMPGGIHYAMDLSQSALLQVWKGEFVDTTGMWRGHGLEQVARPLGSMIEVSGRPSVAVLDDQNVAWPNSLQSGTAYKFKGYELDSAGKPIFQYSLGQVEMEDRIVPEDDDRILRREIRFRARGNGKKLWCLLAEGNDIALVQNGCYSVDGDLFHIRVNETGDAGPVIRTMNGRVELLLPVQFNASSAKVDYSIIW